jgi:hypothetical protein
MPQTSDERRKRWPGWDTQAIEYLEGRGFVCNIKTYTWRNPKGLEINERDKDAVIYLIEEFDWGGFE